MENKNQPKRMKLNFHRMKRNYITILSLFAILYLFLFSNKIFFTATFPYKIVVISVLYLVLLAFYERIFLSLKQSLAKNTTKENRKIWLSPRSIVSVKILIISLIFIGGCLLLLKGDYLPYKAISYKIKVIILPFITAYFYKLHLYRESSIKNWLVASKRLREVKKIEDSYQYVLDGLRKGFALYGTINVKDGEYTFPVVLSEIVYIESNGKLKHIYLNSDLKSEKHDSVRRKISTYDYANFDKLLEKINNRIFIMINKSVVINGLYIESYSKQYVKLRYHTPETEPLKLKLSTNYRNNITDFYSFLEELRTSDPMFNSIPKTDINQGASKN